MNGLTNRNNWIFGTDFDHFTDKNLMIKSYISNMLNRTTRMFEYENLPDTIPQKDFELILQCGGYAILTEVDGKPYAFRGGLGGEPNPYYLPTIATVANPALKFTKNLIIDEECVVVRNDNLYQGILPILTKYATMLIEAEISLKHNIVNSRVPSLVQADNDSTYESAKEFFKKIVDGDQYGIIYTNDFMEGIKTHDFFRYSHIKDIIEAIQYIKGSAFNEIGINAPFNMKREAINEAEAALNEDMLFPIIDTMLECREIGIEQFNRMFNKNVKVKLASVWAKNKELEEVSVELQKANVEEVLSNANAEEEEVTNEESQ